jgi:hypothetical protein
MHKRGYAVYVRHLLPVAVCVFAVVALSTAALAADWVADLAARTGADWVACPAWAA